MGADLSGTGAGQEKPVSDDQFDSGSGSSAGGHGPQKGGDKALGRSRGGLTTKIHLLVNELGLPLDFMITQGQISDYTPAVELLGKRQTEAVIADKGYNSDEIVEHVEQTMQARAVIPPRSNRKHQPEYDKTL